MSRHEPWRKRAHIRVTTYESGDVTYAGATGKGKKAQLVTDEFQKTDEAIKATEEWFAKQPRKVKRA